MHPSTSQQEKVGIMFRSAQTAPLAPRRTPTPSRARTGFGERLLAGLALLVALVAPAQAALTVNSVNFAGAANIAVAPGAAIATTISVTTDATTNWNSTAWRISTTPPGTTTCVNHANHLPNGQTYTETFSITAPTTGGTYNAYFVAANGTSCNGQTASRAFASAIQVIAPILGKTTSSSSAVIGDTVTFSITAKNPANVPLTNVVVTDVLPTGMTYASSVPSLGSVATAGQTITWSIPSIPANDTATLVLAVTLTQKGTLTNTARSTGATDASVEVLVLPNAITHFRLDETAGSWKGSAGEVIDSGGTGLLGKRTTTSSPTTTNAVSPNPTIADTFPPPAVPYVRGSFCNAGSFDGKAVVAVASSPLLQYTTKLSASAWIYPTAYPSGGSDLYSILSNDANYEFHLNPSGKLYWWWGGPTLTSAKTIPLNTWTHVAITLDSTSSGGRQRIYINGVADTNTNNWKGTLSNNPCTFYIGGDVATGSCALRTDRNFKGMIDEIKLYNYELSAAEVQADMTLGRSCSGVFDHVRIEHDGSGSVCAPETVTVKACLDANCSTLYPGNVTLNLSPSGWVGGDTFTISNGLATRQLSVGTPGDVTLGVTNATPAANNPTQCYTSSGASCTMNFASASCAFDGVETGAAPKTRLFTKLAGTGFNLDLLALNSSSGVNTSYTGTVTVDLVDSSTTNCPTGNGLTSAATVTFAAADKGRKPVSFNYPNAARNVRLRARVGSATPACSTDNFAIRPAQFTVSSDMTNATLSGTPRAPAGSPFTLTADGAITSGYDGTPVLVPANVNDHNGVAIASGTLSGTFAAGTGKSATGNAFKYLDVGNIQLASDAVIDTGFTAVDQPSDCIAGSTSNTLSGGEYGCHIGSVPSAKFGRWYPSHYSFSGTLTPACATGGFTYMGQDALGVALTLKAHATTGGTASASDPVTSRYTSVPPAYPGLAPVTLSGDNNGAAVAASRLTSPNFPSMPNTALWTAGQFQINDTYSFSRLAAPDGAYDLFKLKASLADPEGSILIGTSSAQETNTTRIRYGRLLIGNAYGPVTMNLALPAEAQYWNSKGYYLTHNEDSCTSLNLSSVALSNYTQNLTACETSLTPTSPQSMKNGRLSLTLSAPGAGNQGSVQATLNLGSAASGNTCLSGAASAATPANLPWFGANPTGRALFGLRRASYIHLRESY